MTGTHSLQYGQHVALLVLVLQSYQVAGLAQRTHETGIHISGKLDWDTRLEGLIQPVLVSWLLASVSWLYFWGS